MNPDSRKNGKLGEVHFLIGLRRQPAYTDGVNPVAFHLFGRPIFWYGILAASGFLAGLIHWSLLARRAGQPPERASDLALCVMIGGIVGSRVAYILANAGYYLQHPIEIIRLDQGGLIFYGGVIGAVLAIMLLARRENAPLWDLGDFAVSALPLGHAFGRVGCFLNGCCHGVPGKPGGCGVPPAADSAAFDLYGSQAVLPVQLFEAGANLLLYGVLLSLWFRPRRPRPGTGVALYAAGYGAVRFGLEFLRGDERLVWAGLSLAQWISLVLIAVAPVVWVNRGKRRQAD